MKSIKRRRIRGALIPFTLRPRKKYPFRTPIPPRSVVMVRRKRGSLRPGQKFRVGYYSWQDGLDCIWLVDEKGEHNQTIDHEFLLTHFEIETQSKERSLYGRNRPKLRPMA
jgi:hypothetical protein